ncbi:LysR family transcriptional regulator [Streptomyces sp. CC224B]|uniref:LysR family transcriptional regulator n=1 Tax=Streptomyces sp. CC224B TaxID=3044571 RepID=UPI0024A7DA8A|nr:LysR family transcriptional regulator [Streptomyces sp. CC224B]
MATPTLRQLEYLVAVVETGTITDAAARLRVSQPTLSQQLKSLERAVGTPLLERTPRGAHLTPAGRAFLPGARHALTGAERAAGAARAVADMVHGELHLAAVLSVALGVVPGVLAAWHRRHPRVDVVLHEYADLGSFARAVTDATADVALGPLPEGWEGPHHPLGAEEFVALVPPGDPLAGRLTVRLEELADRPWVQYGRHHALAATVEQLCAEAGFTPHAAIRSTQTAAVPRLVAAGLGAGLVPANVLTPDFPGTALRLVPRRRRPLAVFTRPGPHPLIAEFVTTAREHARLTPEHLAGRLA